METPPRFAARSAYVAQDEALLLRLPGLSWLQVIPTARGETLRPFVAAAVEPGSAGTTDGWVGYDGLAALGYRHEAVVIAGDQEVTDNSSPMVHLVFSNLKTWLQGTHHGVSPRHLQAYLNE